MAKILMIRQALGRASLGRSKDQSQCKRKTIDQLNTTLSLLLRVPDKSQIRMEAEKLVEQSVVLMNTMTKEQALFRCFVPIAIDDEDDEEYVDVAENEHNHGS